MEEKEKETLQEEIKLLRYRISADQKYYEIKGKHLINTFDEFIGSYDEDELDMLSTFVNNALEDRDVYISFLLSITMQTLKKVLKEKENEIRNIK